MSYVDGFIIPVHKDRMEDYRAAARLGAEVFKDHGALAVVECFGDDVPYGTLTSFPRSVQATEDEVVVFSWIIHTSREARDATNAKVMADERLKDCMTNPPFDAKRMIWGGFVPFLEA